MANRDGLQSHHIFERLVKTLYFFCFQYKGWSTLRTRRAPTASTSSTTSWLCTIKLTTRTTAAWRNTGHHSNIGWLSNQGYSGRREGGCTEITMGRACVQYRWVWVGGDADSVYFLLWVRYVWTHRMQHSRVCSFNASVIILSHLAIFSRIKQLKVVVYREQILYSYCVALDRLLVSCLVTNLRRVTLCECKSV